MWRLFWEFHFWSEKCTKATEKHCNELIHCDCVFLRTWSARTGNSMRKTWMKLFLSQRMIWKICRSISLPSSLPRISRARPHTLTCAGRSNSPYCFTKTKEISWYVTFDTVDVRKCLLIFLTPLPSKIPAFSEQCCREGNPIMHCDNKSV